MNEYDVCVIGAGSAGLVAATKANRLGAKTILIEKNKIGGECLHSSCIPSKTFLHSSKVYYNSINSEEIGLPKINSKKPNLERIMNHVQAVINGIYKNENKDIFQKMGIDVYLGDGSFISQNEFSAGKDIINSKFFIICSGSSPSVPPVDGLRDIKYLTNNNFWDLKSLPSKIFIMGAGPIGLELGQALSRLGSKVFIALRSEQILKKEDPEISAEMEKILASENIIFLKNTRLNKFSQQADKITIEYSQDGQGKELVVDEVLVSTGRKPNIEGLNLEKAGVEYTKKGISVNDELQTSSENIFACGDVIGKYQFTHAASYYAEIAVNNILSDKKMNINDRIMPWVTFTDPEVAHVGLTEEEARKKFQDIQVLKVDAALDRFLTENKSKGFIKIILDEKDNIIGAHAIGAHAGEYIQNLTLAIQNNISIKQFSETISPYPTFSEIVKKAFTRYLRTKT